jgi:thioredoxin-related protein
MKRVLVKTVTVALVLGCHSVYAHFDFSKKNHQEKELPITKDFTRAKEMARAYQRPFLLVFTGSDWCPYSKQLLAEVIKSEDFAKEVHKRLFVVNLDFPELNPHPDQHVIEQNYQIKEEFHVKEFPLLVLLDADLHEITRMGFSGYTSAEYGRHLMASLNKYLEIKAVLESNNYSSFTDLKKKYLEARELGSTFLVHAILNVGLKHDKECFFHLEKYRLAPGKEEKEEWKKKICILNRDTTNRVALHLAVLEYQERRCQHREDALQPLFDYTKGLKTHMVENLEHWRVHMLIAQHLALDGSVAEALEHIHRSLALSPEEYREELKSSIKLLSADLNVSEERIY